MIVHKPYNNIGFENVNIVKMITKFAGESTQQINTTLLPQ